MSLQRLAKVALGATFIGGWLGRAPFIEAAYKRSALFRRDHSGLFYGVYDNFEAALADIPPTREIGWDNEASAQIWVNEIAPNRAAAFPVFFWLSQILRDGQTVLDFGGSIGVTYYSYSRRARLPDKLRWIIIETPAIAAQGKRIAARESAESLEFGTNLNAVPSCDLLLALGVVQYLKDPIQELLGTLTAKPPHIIVNKVVLTEKEPFWTLQNSGVNVCPYHVFNEKTFIRSFEEAGYRLRDRWGVYEIDCYIPLHPERCAPYLSGLYFQRAD